MADKARATLFLPQQNLYPFAADSKKISTLRNGYGYQLSRGIAQVGLIASGKLFTYPLKLTQNTEIYGQAFIKFASIKFASITDKSMDITMADGSQPSSPDLMEGIEYQGLPRTSGSECASKHLVQRGRRSIRHKRRPGQPHWEARQDRGRRRHYRRKQRHRLIRIKGFCALPNCSRRCCRIPI